MLLIPEVPAVSSEIERLARAKLNGKTKPPGSLGLLEDTAVLLACVQNSLEISVSRPAIIVFAADHGISVEPVSAFPRAVTAQMVLNFARGGAAINVLSRLHGIELTVINAGVDADLPAQAARNLSVARGTRNFLKEAAMTGEELVQCIESGRMVAAEAAALGTNLIGFGEMGIGNTSSAALLTHRFTGADIEACTGRGTGLGDDELRTKINVLKRASALHPPGDAVHTLRTFGGFEIAMMTGAILEAASRRMAILVDGFIATAAFLAAHAFAPAVHRYAIFCHRSAESGHRYALDFLKARPLLDLEMRLGEGTGCALTVPLVRSACAILNEMASFQDAGVSGRIT